MKKMLVIATVVLSSTIAFAQSTSVASPVAAATSQSKGAGSIAVPSTIVDAIKKPSKWQGSVFYSPYNSAKAVNNGRAGDAMVADAFVQARRDIGNGQKLALRINAAYNQTDRSKDDEWALTDPQILYSFPTFSSTFRLSLPVSEWGQDIGRYELRYNGGQDILQSGKFTLTGLTEARAYAYTKEEDGQRTARARLGAAAMYEINKYVSPYAAALYQWDTNYNGKGLTAKGEMKSKADRQDTTIIDVGAEVNVIPKTLHLNAYVEQERARNTSADTALFAEDSTSYYLEFTVSM